MNLTVIIPTIVADRQMLDKAIFQVRWTAPDAEILAPSGGTFAENCNYGAQMSTADVLVFLNDDTEVQPGWWQPLLAALEAGAHIAGSRLTYPDGRIQHAGVHFGVVDGILHGFNWQEPRPSGEVDAVTGACLAIRKADFNTLGGFDEEYRNGNEDIDLCLMCKARGGKIVYCADSHVVHHESRSGPARWAHVGENVARLQEKWSVRSQPAST